MANHKMDILKNSPPRRLLSGSPLEGVGQPPKLTPELQAKFCDLLSKGNYPETVCRACRIHYSTWRYWIRKGELGVEPYASFYNAVHEASAAGEMYHVNVMYEAAKDDWRASQAFLKMKDPEKWNRQEVNISHTLSKVSDEALHEAIGSGENALKEMEKRIMLAIEGVKDEGEMVEGEVIDVDGGVVEGEKEFGNKFPEE